MFGVGVVAAAALAKVRESRLRGGPMTTGMSNASAKDTTLQLAPPAPLRFERRRSERKPAQGSAVAVFDRPGRSPLLTSVKVTDSAPGGLGVQLDNEIKPGTTFAIYPDDASMPRRFGRVVACSRLRKGYRLGMQFQQAIAA